MSNPDPYPQVFWPPNVTPRSVRILSHRSLGTAGQIPMGHEYPQVWSGEFVDVWQGCVPNTLIILTHDITDPSLARKARWKGPLTRHARNVTMEESDTVTHHHHLLRMKHETEPRPAHTTHKNEHMCSFSKRLLFASVPPALLPFTIETEHTSLVLRPPPPSKMSHVCSFLRVFNFKSI